MRGRRRVVGLVVGAHRVAGFPSGALPGSPPGSPPAFPHDPGEPSAPGGASPPVAEPGGGARVALDPPLRPGSDPAPALHRGLAALEALGVLGAPDRDQPVQVALLPPLVEARFVALPPLSHEEAVMVLRRDVARHFPGAGGANGGGGGLRGSVVVGVGPAVTTREGQTGRFVAVASQGLLEGILAVLRARGYDPRHVAPAQGGWAAAAAEAGADLVGVVEGETLHLVGLEEGQPVRARRLPLGAGQPGASALDQVLAAAELAPAGVPGRVLLPGAPTGLAKAFQRAGWRRVSGGDGAGAGAGPEPRTEPLADPPPDLASDHCALTGLATASGRWGASDPEGALLLVPPSLEAARRSRENRLSVRLAAAAVVLILLAGAIHLLGARAELRAVQAERRALASDVAPVLALRDSLETMEARLASLRTLEDGLPRWSFALVELAMVLPAQTHLTALRTAGDTLALDAEGGRAGDVLSALRGSGTFHAPRLEGPIQRTLDASVSRTGDAADDADSPAGARERFTLSAILRRDGAPHE